jgi:hypothetical protein
MLQPEYQTVFEIGLKSLPWDLLLHPLPFVLGGVLLFRLAKGKQLFLAVGILLAAFAGLIFVLAAVTLIPEFLTVRSAHRRGDSAVAQGIVENFKPAPTLGPQLESFSVNGTRFSYYLGATDSCFHNAPAHKGPVRAGLDVRIYYRDECIQRVDIRR